MRLGELQFTLNLVFFMLAMNFAFGNWFMQIAPFGVPLNELLCLILALRWLEKILNFCKHKFIILMIILWSSYSLVILLPLGLIEYGLVAGRDATGQIDILILPIMVAVTLLRKKEIPKSSFENFLIIALVLEFLDRSLLGPFLGSSDASKMTVHVFGGTIGSQLIVFLSLWYGIASANKNNIFKPVIYIFLSCALILLLQNRFLYFGFFAGIVVLLFLADGFIKKAPIIILTIVVVFFTVRGLTDYLIAIVPEASRLMKYVNADISISAIFSHLATSFGGVENQIYTGAAGGLAQRIGWWVKIINTAIEDSSIMFFGQGFGVPLTSDYVAKVIREPHNSYISVFARGGIIYFCIWLFIQVQIIFHLMKAYVFFRSLRKLRSEAEFYCNLSLAVFLLGLTVLITALVEPAFELPPYAFGYYALCGIVFGTVWREKDANSHK